MQLPAELVSLAVRGIDGQASVNQIAIETTLRDCAIYSLQHRAGFIPRHDTSNLYVACSHSTGQHIQLESLKHLHIILRSYPMMLQEWVQAVCSIEKTIPDEYIPYFLNQGCEQVHLQAWFKLVMSERAQWLVKHHPQEKWTWYDKCDISSIDELITAQNNENWKMAHFIHVSLSMTPVGNGHHNGLAKLNDYLPMWRQQTAKLLIEAIFVANATAGYLENSLLSQVVQKATYRMPLNFADELLATLRPGNEQWQAIADKIEAIFTMRYDMLKTILEDSS